jgi:hypothetical protein
MTTSCRPGGSVRFGGMAGLIAGFVGFIRSDRLQS